MIVYTSDLVTDRFIISIEGHAGSAPEGHDLVCAAASALALTLVEAARSLDRDGEATHIYTSVGKGEVAVDVTVKERALERAKTAFDTIMNGFLLLEEKYPDFVCVE